MPFPRKLESLLETTLADVEVPSHAWIVYAVFAVAPVSCGWGGWVLDGVFLAEGESRQLIPSHGTDHCPRCGKPLHRTAAEIRVERSPEQAPRLVESVDHEAVPMVYSDGE